MLLLEASLELELWFQLGTWLELVFEQRQRRRGLCRLRRVPSQAPRVLALGTGVLSALWVGCMEKV